ncbi:MAG TPA: ABC-2 transporter permease [Steroidobacteraceae bacterium]|jgi:ABC-2 type transport system permease protein|nr:ABC-2 transporter permease [Steroidobacteraceae bacterium]
MNANAAELAPVRAPSGRAGTLEALVWLVRRELWEHRSLWIAPLVVEALLVVCLLIGHIEMDYLETVLQRPQRVAILTIVQWAFAQPLFIVAVICVAFYLLDSLYAERKDRSILFWKSLPVSDELTVASKFLVAAVVVPLGVFVLASLGSLIFSAIVELRVPAAVSWDTVEWLRTELVLLLTVILGVLWYAPIGGALLLFSAWIRRAPILWAILVPIVAPIVEYVGLHTTYISNFERYRISGIWKTLAVGHEQMFVAFNFGHPQQLRPIGIVLDNLNFGRAFTDLDLWMGVLAAVLMAYAAARIRRFREEG